MSTLMVGRGRRLLAIAIAPVLVVGSLSLGPRIGPFALLPGLPRAEALDYDSRPAPGLAPLSGRFVDSVLGASTTADSEIASGPGSSPSGTTSTNSGLFAQRLTDVHPLTNDDIADARFVPSVPYTAKTDTRRATREGGEADACAPLGESTVWYRYTPPANMGLIASTFGSSYAIALGAFSGEPGKLAGIDCDTDTSGSALVAFPAKKSVTYYFQIAGPAGGGDLVFDLEPQGVSTIQGISTSGKLSDWGAYEPFISDSGRFLVFSSNASNLAAGTDGCESPLIQQSVCDHIYVRDMVNRTTTIVDVDSRGRIANGLSGWPSISGNDRFVVFHSQASNLVGSDTNDRNDVFVHDLVTRRTELVSTESGGSGSAGNPFGATNPTITSDGRYVAFNTRSPLVPEDGNGIYDVYVHDRLLKRTERVSLSSDGRERGPEMHPCPGNCQEDDPASLSLASSISPNGRYVKFQTSSQRIVPGDDGTAYDTFVRDRLARTTIRVSVDSAGNPATNTLASSRNSRANEHSFSADGRYVIFSTSAELESQDNNSTDPEWNDSGSDVYVHDMRTRRTFRANLSSSGKETPEGYNSVAASISANGRYVAFQSDAPNLVPRDTNGVTDVFVRDLKTRTTIRVSVTRAGETVDRAATNPSLSADGRLTAYQSLFHREESGGQVTFGDNDQVYVHRRVESGR